MIENNDGGGNGQQHMKKLNECLDPSASERADGNRIILHVRYDIAAAAAIRCIFS